MAAVAAKYRPVLTAAEITAILELIAKQAVIPSELASARRTLAPFLFKIQQGIATPAYQAAAVRSTVASRLEDALAASPSSPADSPASSINQFMSPQEKREAAFAKWEKSPANCSEEELELAITYRLDNGLLSEDEELAMMDAAMAKLISS